MNVCTYLCVYMQVCALMRACRRVVVSERRRDAEKEAYANGFVYSTSHRHVCGPNVVRTRSRKSSVESIEQTPKIRESGFLKHNHPYKNRGENEEGRCSV